MDGVWAFVERQKPRKNKQKQKKTTSSDPWTGSGERPGRGHWSEPFVLWFFHCFLQFGQNLSKLKKQQVETHGQGLGRGLAGDKGLNLFFCFSMVFCMFFM